MLKQVHLSQKTSCFVWQALPHQINWCYIDDFYYHIEKGNNSIFQFSMKNIKEKIPFRNYKFYKKIPMYFSLSSTYLVVNNLILI